MSVGKPGEMAAPEGRGPPLKLEDESFVPLDDMDGLVFDDEVFRLEEEDYYEGKDEKTRRAMRVSESVRRRSGVAAKNPWPVIPAISRALLGTGKVLDKDPSMVRRIRRRMARWEEEKLEKMRFFRVLSVKCHSKPGVQMYTTWGDYAGLKDGWSWFWGEERRTVVGRPMTLREVRRLPACDLKIGVWQSPGPWMKQPGQEEKEWWLIWTPIIERILEAVGEEEVWPKPHPLRACLAVPEVLAMVRLMAESRRIKLESVLDRRHRELVSYHRKFDEHVEKDLVLEEGWAKEEWLNGHQLSEDADEAVALQVFDWEEVRHKGKIVVKVMGPEEGEMN